MPNSDPEFECFSQPDEVAPRLHSRFVVFGGTTSRNSSNDKQTQRVLTLNRFLSEQSRLAEDVSENTSIKEMSIRVCRILSHSLHSSCGLWKVVDGHLYQFVAPVSAPFCRLGNGINIANDHGPSCQSARTGQSIFVADIVNDDRWKSFSELEGSHSFRSCWAIPLMRSERVVGVVTNFLETPRLPTPEELSLINGTLYVLRMRLGIRSR
ncbi:MAG: GAF domain-containing protein [Planctomycetes bacterium]|nr:GAF domain-containing protein [Planctomycetota bacterium]